MAPTTMSWASANGVEVPDTVAEDGSYYPHVPLFAGRRVYTSEGVKGDANRAVSDALDKAGKLLAFGRITPLLSRIPGAPRRR